MGSIKEGLGELPLVESEQRAQSMEEGQGEEQQKQAQPAQHRVTADGGPMYYDDILYCVIMMVSQCVMRTEFYILMSFCFI